MTDVTIKPAQSVQGYVELPGDKSVSHRAVMLAALGSKPIRLTNLAMSDDVRSTVAAMAALGAKVEHDERDATIVTITGNGMRGLTLADGEVIDCGNAGTLARLLPGLLVGQNGSFTLTGDESLTLRPMRRVSGPLSAMGATIRTSANGTLPMTVSGTADVRGIDLGLEIPSAQVQTAVLFAGLFANERTTVTETAQMRDHTERMLRRAGVKITRSGNTVTVQPADAVELPDTIVPADPSSAAPFVVAASLLRGSRLRLPGVMINPGRSGLFDVMERMHAAVGMLDRRTVDGEP
ncbi:MAG: 3-phosphoshikimate 1-carboxyvinyltransferase, partial [Thermoleophilia bacterium]|nr:3-phosphoshikimate 1-carboxyvinyltransferase [Thermoleophilia bacterium]